MSQRCSRACLSISFHTRLTLDACRLTLDARRCNFIQLQKRLLGTDGLQGCQIWHAKGHQMAPNGTKCTQKVAEKLQKHIQNPGHDSCNFPATLFSYRSGSLAQMASRDAHSIAIHCNSLPLNGIHCHSLPFIATERAHSKIHCHSLQSLAMNGPFSSNHWQ